MKLIGSNAEREFREVLMKGHTSLFNNQSYLPLLAIVKEQVPNMKTAYFIDAIPEQGETFYTLLIDLNIIIRLEVSQSGQELLSPVEMKSVNDYKKGLSKMKQVQLAVAVDLAKKDIDNFI